MKSDNLFKQITEEIRVFRNGWLPNPEEHHRLEAELNHREWEKSFCRGDSVRRFIRFDDSNGYSPEEFIKKELHRESLYNESIDSNLSEERRQEILSDPNWLSPKQQSEVEEFVKVVKAHQKS